MNQPEPTLTITLPVRMADLLNQSLERLWKSSRARCSSYKAQKRPDQAVIHQARTDELRELAEAVAESLNRREVPA